MAISYNLSFQGAKNFSIRMIHRFLSPSFRKNKRRWKALKGKYKGKRVFLIGNGPSLNKTPLYLLKNEYTLCFNRFDLMTERFCWNPYFFAMADSTVCEDIIEVVKQTIEKCKYSFFVNDTEGADIEMILPQKDNVLFFYHEFHKFSKNLPYLRGGQTVAIEGLQILNYLGFEEIILIGVDMNYVIHTSSVSLKKFDNGGEIIQSTADDDPNHFDPRYFGKGAKYSQPNETIMEKMLAALYEISEWFKSNTSTKVYNAGYDSKVESFERRDFLELLGYSEEKINMLFLEVVNKFGFNTIEDLQQQTKVIDNLEEWNEKYDYFSLPTKTGAPNVKSFVLNYIPIGPYNGRIYFVKRK